MSKGLGQAIVDYAACVPDEMLQSFSVSKGLRRVISVDERSRVMEALQENGCTSQVSAGGSLANTLLAVSRLSAAAGTGMRVSMAAAGGTDTLASFFSAQMRSAGVTVLPGSSVAGHTGTVMVLTTPDAQRTFLSFFDSSPLLPSPELLTAVSSARMVAIEGYLWELPGALEYIRSVISVANTAGVLVVLSAGDPGVVARHLASITAVLNDGGVDILFANADEACQLLDKTDCGMATSSCSSQAPSPESASAPCDVNGGSSSAGSSSSDESSPKRSEAEEDALSLTARVPIVIVTDGSKGSVIASRGANSILVPPYWADCGPIDTCGAGDGYAAGILYGLLSGHSMRTSGEFASKVASSVISRHGAQLSEEDALLLIAQLPELSPAEKAATAAVVTTTSA